MVKKLGTGAALGILGGVAFLYWSCGALLPWREPAEAERLAEVAGIVSGRTVAEIGAGSGRFTVRLAQIVGSDGRMFSTELTAENLAAIRQRADAAGLRNVTVVEAGERDTNLPERCCDVVFMRNVYHHVSDPEALAASLRRTVRPGGRLAVIDFEPGAIWFIRGRPEEAPARRTGHGVPRADAVAELTSAGFRLEREIPRWSGPLWLALFEAPADD